MLSNLLKPSKPILAASAFGMGVGGVVGYYKYFYNQGGSARLQDWVDKWKQYTVSNEKPPWDSGHANSCTKYLNELYGFNDMPPIRRPIQIRIIRCFAPLCGDSRDMVELNKHFQSLIKQQPKEKQSNYKIKIIGVEAAATAIDSFYDRECGGDYSIDYDLFSKIPIYTEKNYNIINADVFDPAMSRLVLAADCIYDVGSLSVIDPKYRNDYIKFCENILSQNGRVLLRSWSFDEQERSQIRQEKAKKLSESSGISKLNGDPVEGAPYPLDKEQVFELYKNILKGDTDDEKRSNLTLLESQQIETSNDPWLKSKLNEFDITHGTLDVYLINGNAAKALNANRNAART